jgi:hypothetical protein
MVVIDTGLEMARLGEREGEANSRTDAAHSARPGSQLNRRGEPPRPSQESGEKSYAQVNVRNGSSGVAGTRSLDGISNCLPCGTRWPGDRAFECN